MSKSPGIFYPGLLFHDIHFKYDLDNILSAKNIWFLNIKQFHPSFNTPASKVK